MEEITKHTLKIYKTLRNPGTPLSKKIAEIVMEVMIIVFAVTLAQFLERQREKNVKQQEVRGFLLGLKNDMQGDIAQVKMVLNDYNNYKEAYTFMSKLKPSSQPDTAKLNAAVSITSNNSFLRPNISRFEGFKSSGKLEEIEDKKLLQAVLFYYEQAVPQLKGSEGGWQNLQHQLAQIITDDQVVNDDGTNNNLQIITQPKAHNLCKKLIPWAQLLERYNIITNTAEGVLKQINKDYPGDRAKTD